MSRRKCAIVGLGKVGTAASLAFATSGLFDELVLCGRDPDKRWAEAQDLTHAASLMARPCEVTSAAVEAVRDCAVILITAGVSQSMLRGGERTAGIQACGDMIGQITAQMAPNNPDAVLLLVTNPVEAMVWKAVEASGFSARQVISTGTVLDSARFQNAVGSLLGIAPRDINALVLGEHSQNAFPLMSAATVGGVSLRDVLDEEEKMMVKAAINDVRKEPFLILRGKGGTSSAVAMAALRVAEAVVTDANALLTVSVCPADIPALSDVCVNLPCVVGRGGVKRIIMPTMDAQEQAQFARCLASIRANIQALR